MKRDDSPTDVDSHVVTVLMDDSLLSRPSSEDRDRPVQDAPSHGRAQGGLAAASRFVARGQVGIGGMGEVHRAYDQVLQRQVAMKSLQQHLASRETPLRRFLQEVLITGQLDHPNIVPVYDVGFHRTGNAFFVMKLVRGENLAARLAAHQGRPLTSRELERYLRIFLKVCEAIDFAHSRGVIHRDLKPSNVMVGPHGEVYVMDWGIALVRDRAGHARSIQADEGIQEQGVIVGSAAYMAPEQAWGRTDEIDARTDIFALGGILYQILTNQPPYPGPRPELQVELARRCDVHHPARVVQDRRLPPQLCRITMKALAREREGRYQTVAELVEDVEAFLRGGGWFDTVFFPAGTIIIREGDVPDAAYIIEQGHCEVYKVRRGKRHFLRRLGPGDVFGETAIFRNALRTANVAAIDDVRVASITREALDYELAEKGWLAAFVKALAERFSEYDASSTSRRLETES